jgi:DNA mismatch endonuclease (patch repair protein)
MDQPKTPSFKGFRPSSAASSRAKQANRRRDTRAETALRREVWSLGLRYRKNVQTILGEPDLVFARARIVVFCDGDFWHGRNWRSLRTELRHRANPEYWIPKIRSNMERDRRNNRSLAREGWYVVRLWETDVLGDTAAAARQVKAVVEQRLQESSRG